MQSIILGPDRDEVTGGWRKLRNEELHDFYAALNIFRVIKMGRMKRTGHGTHTGEEKSISYFGGEN
jgi:hypothetical protein